MSAIRDAETQLRADGLRSTGRPGKLILHFTCLEMNDDPGIGSSKAYSLASRVADAARSHGVQLKGENALPIGSPTGWADVLRHLARDGYRGINVLRMGRGLDSNALASFIRSASEMPSQPPAADRRDPGLLPRLSLSRPRSFWNARDLSRRTFRAPVLAGPRLKRAAQGRW